MDSVLKVVYSRWLTFEDTTIPFPNGNSDEFFSWAQQKIRENNLKPCGDFDRFESIDDRYFYNDADSCYYFRHSNFYYHCKKNNIKFVSEKDIDDGALYLYPVEIECNTIQFILQPTRQYDFLRTISNNLLTLFQNKKCKILLVNMIDPAIYDSVVDEINDYFSSIGIDEIYMLQGNCRQIKYKNIRMFDSIISLYQTANEMDRYPYQTSLGYVSDFVREIKDIKRKKKFISFNRFLHRAHRTGLAHTLIENNMLDQGYFSFLYCPSENYSDLLKMLDLPIKNAEKIKELVPYQLDTHHLPLEELPKFFTVTNFLLSLYENSYIHIVTETQFEDTLTPFLSEKTWRPILNLQPFLIMGNPGSLKKLKDLGFKTFEPFINESYDLVLDGSSRFSLIEKEIIKLNSMSIDQIHNWYMSIKDDLYFNQKLLYTYKNYNPLCNLLNSNSYTHIG